MVNAFVIVITSTEYSRYDHICKHIFIKNRKIRFTFANIDHIIPIINHKWRNNYAKQAMRYPECPDGPSSY